MSKLLSQLIARSLMPALVAGAFALPVPIALAQQANATPPTAAEIERRPEALDRRAEALRHCVQKLPSAHRVIVLLRYYEDREIDEIAARSERTSAAVYRLLSRIRSALNDCVSRELASARPSA
jgi:DNA-directed RNA polymerase specialized sigma24 family protein